jgi:type II secretory ATPase GspE/PulE/Tfp pilus assembly ATPase PilB-like protein
LRDELELHVSGKASRINVQKDFLQLSAALNARKKNKKETSMQMDIQQLTEQIIWDAFDHGSRLVHIYPSKGKYEISYRSEDGLDKLSSIQEEFFKELDSNLIGLSAPIGQENSRRMYLNRDEGEALQIRYQKIETVTGPRLTLRIWQPEKDVLILEKILGGDQEAHKKFKSWVQATHGIILVTGAPGSGKTTTVYSLLNELCTQERVIFTIEDTVDLVIEGVNQIELKSRKAESFEDAFSQISSSDPDVICFGLSYYYGNEEQVFGAAYEAAATGHLVVVQLSETTPQAAVELFKKHTKYNIEPLLVGACSQILIPEGNGKRRVKYTFLS